MDFRLDDEQKLIVSTIRRFADKELREWSGDADRQAEPPAALFDLAGELGFFIDAVPAEKDGMLEGDYSHLLRALRGVELGRGCPALSALLETNVEGALAVAKWGKGPLTDRVFGALTQPGLIATAHDFEGRLQVEGTTLSGTTHLVPAAGQADFLLLLADELVAVIDKSQASVDEQPTSGWRAGRWARWSFDKLAVPAEQILASGSKASEVSREILAWARVSLAARAVGAATAAMEHAESYGKERVQFKQPIGSFESLIRMRDENETATRAARLLVLEAAFLLDRGDASAFDAASRARDLAAQVVARATIDAVQIYGGYGFVNDYPVEKLMRDARAFEVLFGNESFSRVLQQKAQSGQE
jgi:alkylation response protein AidB-like acyl-CoA dehydrogenase